VKIFFYLITIPSEFSSACGR